MLGIYCSEGILIYTLIFDKLNFDYQSNTYKKNNIIETIQANLK